MDCETLPRLQAAAEKFGGTPNQLKIINDFLTEGQSPAARGLMIPGRVRSNWPTTV